MLRNARIASNSQTLREARKGLPLESLERTCPVSAEILDFWLQNGKGICVDICVILIPLVGDHLLQEPQETNTAPILLQLCFLLPPDWANRRLPHSSAESAT